jgi:hypothetical protein
MIHPTDEQLLSGIATALKDTVLPELARGSAARKQLQAAIETLRRMAFAAPGRDAALATDNADMAEVVRRVEEILRANSVLPRHSPPSNPPPSRGRGNEFENTVEISTPEMRLPLEGGGRHAVPGGGEVAIGAVDENRTLQAKLATLQAFIPPELTPQITPLLTQLYARMTDRALALLPPPMPRTPKTPT